MDWLTTLIGRTADCDPIREWVVRGMCGSIVGVSNTGKTALLRHLCDPTTVPRVGTFVYVDCNQMPARTARAFFSAMGRALTETLRTQGDGAAYARARQLYADSVDAADETVFAFNFEKGLAHALDALPHPLVLCLDDFDEAYRYLEPQTFLNLRALKDRYGSALAYVTATERELSRLTRSREQGEFHELIGPRVHFLHWLTSAETRELCERFAAREGVTFSDADIAFVWDNAGGHLGLALAVCHALGAVTGAPARSAQQDRVIHRAVQQALATDTHVQSECAKIWDDLDADERDALFARPTAEAEDIASRSLRAKHILRETPDGTVIFPRLFDDYVRRQKLLRQPEARGVYVDADAGNVWVEGKPIESLTALEYRLLLFLYGRLDRVCDKYSIVQGVWGEDFIDTVDDARIEKLVSRVRAKIEPDATKPRYLVSVRGRGYKLVR